MAAAIRAIKAVQASDNASSNEKSLSPEEIVERKRAIISDIEAKLEKAITEIEQIAKTHIDRQMFKKYPIKQAR